MARISKRKKQTEQIVPKKDLFTVKEAIEVLQKCPKKFDESIDISLKLCSDPKKPDQQVRGVVTLPHGTGKKLRVVVFAKADKAELALKAGADFAGDQELIEKIKGGWTDFDAVVATPDMMKDLGKIAKILGPRGLMPSPKAGTITLDIEKTVKEIKAGKVEFKADKSASIHIRVAPSSFAADKIEENIQTLIQAIVKAKPSAVKGNVFIRSFYLTTTMGPGLAIDMNSLTLG